MSSAQSSSTQRKGLELALKLKEEGNVLHTKKKFRAAYKKYTEAISHDPNNAVLYANRAASNLGMKEYLDASHDAQAAIDIDPSYSKAYARLATAAQATGNFDMSKQAWEDALGTLPRDGELTETQKALKTQFEEGIRTANKSIEEQLARAREHVVELGTEDDLDNLPWRKALAMEAELTMAQDHQSSAWVIMNASRDFDIGRKTMDKYEEVSESDGRIRSTVTTGALGYIVSALMRDPRIFHVSSEFLDKCIKQVGGEVRAVGGWPTGGVNLVQKEALARLKASGWSSIRPALATTIRMWVLKGFLGFTAGNHRAATEFYRQALDILEWGCKEWEGIAREDKGATFDRSFVRAVRKLYLPSVMSEAKREGSRYVLEDVVKIAFDIIKDNKADDPRLTLQKFPLDHGSLISYWFYDRAEALTGLGWYHMQKAFLTEDVEEKLHHFTESAHNYIEAAETYAYDDEYHPYFLAVALEAFWHANAPLRVTLPLCERVRLAMPDAMRIWENSQMAGERSVRVGQALEFEKEARKLLREGTATLEDMMKPDLQLDPKKVPVRST